MKNIVNAMLMAEGKIMLARRAPHRRAYPNTWSLPGGHVEDGETYDEALVRELAEELGVQPLHFSLIMEIVDPNATTEPITYHLFAVTEWNGDPTIIDDEHTDLCWFSFSEARQLSGLALEEYRPLFASLG